MTPHHGHMVSEKIIPKTLVTAEPCAGSPGDAGQLALAGGAVIPLGTKGATVSPATSASDGFHVETALSGQSLRGRARGLWPMWASATPQRPWEGGQGSRRASRLPDAKFTSSDLEPVSSPPLLRSAGE